MSEDIELLPAMNAAGWKETYHVQDKLYKRFLPDHMPHHSLHFEKGNIHIWKCGTSWNKNGWPQSWWQVAERDEHGYYSNHRGGTHIMRRKDGTYGPLGTMIDRFPDTFGFIPDLKTVLELDAKGEL